MNERRGKLTRLAVTAMLAAVALVMSFFERTLSAGLPLPPGVKPGFANIAVMFACAAVGLPAALLIVAVKAGFSLLVFGAAAGFLSLCGGLLSTLVLFCLLKIKTDKMTYIGVSAVSAVAHNAGQLIGASLMAGSALYLNWLPALLVSGVVFGVITGVILNAVMPALMNTRFFDKTEKSRKS